MFGVSCWVFVFCVFVGIYFLCLFSNVSYFVCILGVSWFVGSCVCFFLFGGLVWDWQPDQSLKLRFTW